MNIEDFFGKYQGARRLVVVYTLALTGVVTYLGWQFAQVSKFDGLGTAAIIAAFTAPTAWLQRSAFSDYMSAKDRTE